MNPNKLDTQTKPNQSVTEWLDLGTVPFCEAQESGTHERFKLKDIENVKLPADDKLLAHITKWYLAIQPSSFQTFNEDGDILYDALRYDPESAGSVNREDLTLLRQTVLADCIQANNPDAFNAVKSSQVGFLTFKSWNLYGGEKMHSRDMCHRLYINSRADNIFKLSLSVYDKFKQKNIPFYFKTHTAKNAEKGPKDSFVLYTSTEHLEDTINTLQEMEHDAPEVIQGCNAPSELTGQITPWLGYGSEVSENPTSSYTGLICDGCMAGINNALAEEISLIGGETINLLHPEDKRAYSEQGLLNKRFNSSFPIHHVYQDQDLPLNERRALTQDLVYGIQKYFDPDFKECVYRHMRRSLRMKGLNDANLCLTAYAQEQIKSATQH